MYDTGIPSAAELPSSVQLIRSTILAMAAAAGILVVAVLPAEYGIDPTGIGKVLGLTEMGEIKAQLSKEAEADRAAGQNRNVPAPVPDKCSSLIGTLIAQFLVGPAAAQAVPTGRQDEISVTLKPGEAAEVKLQMLKGRKATFSWTVVGGVVNYDLHGEPDGNPSATHSYKKDRGVGTDKGELTAAFDGNHGWFWRNRTQKEVTITLRASGDYRAIKRVL